MNPIYRYRYGLFLLELYPDRVEIRKTMTLGRTIIPLSSIASVHRGFPLYLVIQTNGGAIWRYKVLNPKEIAAKILQAKWEYEVRR